jgi:hypothetical protein
MREFIREIRRQVAWAQAYGLVFPWQLVYWFKPKTLA